MMIPRSMARRLVAETVGRYIERLADPQIAEALAAGDLARMDARMDVIERELLSAFREQLAALEVAGSA